MSADREVVIIGLGSAGCRFLDTCSRRAEVTLPRSIAMHTDEQALDACAAENKMLLGANLLQGESTGGSQGLGRQAAEADRQSIEDVLAGVDLLFLVTGLGGGTGTGIAPLLARWAREYGTIVICFAIQPFFFEGGVKRSAAEEGLTQLRRDANAVVQLSNQNIYNWAGEDTGMQDAFEKINLALMHNLSAMIDLLVSPGIIANVRFSDFEELLKHSGGLCTMGYGEGGGEDRALQAVNAVIANPVLGKDNVIKTASGLMVGIIGGPDLTVLEVGRIMEEIPKMARSDVHLTMGAVTRASWHERIGVAVFAAEKWEDEESVAGEPSEAADEQDDNKPTRAPRRRKQQTRLALQPKGKGFFNDIEPTLFEGEDLDVPTFQRKNIKI
jgi:cell division protein FtsZ